MFQEITQVQIKTAQDGLAQVDLAAISHTNWITKANKIFLLQIHSPKMRS